MKLGLSCLVLATTLPISFVSASSSLLSQGRSITSSQAISVGRARLQAAASELAHALKPFSNADLAIARDHLGRTVDKLLNNAQAGNRRGPELLRSYVMRAPSSALIWPLNDLSVRVSPLPGAFNSFDSDLASDSSASQGSPAYDEMGQTASSMSEETVMRDGNLVKRITRCRNGDCVQETKVAKDPAKETWLAADERSMLAPSGLGKDNVGSSIAEAAQRMASEMSTVESLMGSNGLNRLLDGLERQGISETASDSNAEGHSETSEETVVRGGRLVKRVTRCHNGDCVQETKIAKDPAKETWLDAGDHSMLNRSRLGVDIVGSSIADAAQTMANDMDNLNGLMGSNGLERLLNDSEPSIVDAASSDGNARGHAETFESETNVKNGKLIRRVRRCQDGHCTTQVQKADATDNIVEPDEEEQQQQGKTIQMPL